MSNTPTPEQMGESTTTGTTQYASANSAASEQGQQPSPEPCQCFKIHADVHGISYLHDTTTGNRYELSEDEMELNDPLPEAQGTASDVFPSSPSLLTEPPPNIMGEEILAVLVADLQNGPLTVEQSWQFDSIRGMLSLMREYLLTTAGMVAGQRYETGHLFGSLHMLRDEIDALSEAVVGASHKPESALENNLRILRVTGTTDVRLAELAASICSSAHQPVMLAPLHPAQAGPLAQLTDMEEQQPSIDRALPPQRAHKPSEAFEQCARAALTRCENAAGTFQAAKPSVPTDQEFLQQEPPHMVRHVRFNAMDSTSTAGT
ncbi:hypothetical protein K438DRAFT_1979998 [Mycena galopus ATCC 62051]|nr:hypothetical protein K438DRAFT_1979998 [Mycena galopus ATCC 62051]